MTPSSKITGLVAFDLLCLAFVLCCVFIAARKGYDLRPLVPAAIVILAAALVNWEVL